MFDQKNIVAPCQFDGWSHWKIPPGLHERLIHWDQKMQQSSVATTEDLPCEIFFFFSFLSNSDSLDKE